MLVAVLSLGCTPRKSPESLTASHRAAIQDSVRSTLDAYTKLCALSQWDSVIDFYSADPGFRWVEDGQVRARSVADIRRGLTSIPKNFRVLTTYQDMDITAVAPGVASVVTCFHTQFADSTGSGPSFGGILTMTMVHEPGRWRFITGSASAAKPEGASGR